MGGQNKKKQCIMDDVLKQRARWLRKTATNRTPNSDFGDGCVLSSQHQQQIAYDQQGTDYLSAQGFTLLRFWNHEVLQ